MDNEVTFKHPPVVETVLGIQFERMQFLTNAHFGAFWQQRKSEWPFLRDAPLLDEQFETFGEKTDWSRAVHLKVPQSPAARVQMTNLAEDRMIQLQNCRLDYNWIGQSGLEDPKYPRYQTVRNEFDTTLRGFENLISECVQGSLIPTQWEVTYVNHLLKGTVWNDPQDWPTVFDGLPGLAVTPQNTRFEGFGGHWHFEIVPQRGRLHVELHHAKAMAPDEREALVLKLTARGPIEKANDKTSGIDKGLNLGHDMIVTSFRDLTSKRAHDYWNKEDYNVEL